MKNKGFILIWLACCLFFVNTKQVVAQASVRFNESGISVVFKTETTSPKSDKTARGSVFVKHVPPGAENMIQRVISDRESGLYTGYDLVVAQDASTGKFRVSFRPLSLKRDQGESSNNVAARSLPKYPEDVIVDDGDTIALEIFENPQLQLKIVDMITITSKAPKPNAASSVNNASTASGRAKDFTPQAPELKLTNFDIFVNEAKAIEPSSGRGGGGSVSGAIIYFYLEGKGRFIFSLSPHEGYDFQKIAVIEDNQISFTFNGESYKLISSSPVFGEGGNWNLWVLHDPDYRPNVKFFGSSRYLIGAADRIEYLLKKKQ